MIEQGIQQHARADYSHFDEYDGDYDIRLDEANAPPCDIQIHPLVSIGAAVRKIAFVVIAAAAFGAFADIADGDGGKNREVRLDGVVLRGRD